MAQNPQDWARKLQETIQQRSGKGFGGGPKFPLGAIGGLAVIVGGALVVNNALFNGERGYLLTMDQQ